jgi:predicted methyltransferase
MYRNLWFKDQQFAWPDDSQNVHLQDQYRNDFGLSLRFGGMRRYGRFVIDYYIGGGFKTVILRQSNYGMYDDFDNIIIYNNPDHSADVTNTTRIGLVLNLGIKIGGAF